MRTPLIPIIAALAVAACERGGTSSDEARAAAIEKARQELRLAPDVPLEARVWVGAEQYDDQPVLCGTVSGQGSGSQTKPQRFAATGDPIRWLIFEDAHDALLATQPDKFAEWERLCRRSD